MNSEAKAENKRMKKSKETENNMAQKGIYKKDRS